MSMRHSNDYIAIRLLAKSAEDVASPLIEGRHCRMFTGARRGGYGRMSDGERVQQAQRLAYEVWIGPIPAGKEACHHCDQPGCIEPRHLWAGTEKQNTADMIAKGRHLDGRRAASVKRQGQPNYWGRGARHALAKMDETKVRAILLDPRSGVEIAEAYGISASLVYGIKKGRNWGWLLAPKVATVPRRVKPRLRRVPPHLENYPTGPLRLRDVLKKG